MNAHTQMNFSQIAKAGALAALLLLMMAALPSGTRAVLNNSDLEGGGGGGGGTTVKQCDDGIDNDSNGLTDYPADPGCTGTIDNAESGYTTGTVCSDNVDNDGNGVKDFPADLGCTSAADTTEAGYTPPAQCADGTDNDGNGLTDYPSDLGCSSAADTTEAGYVTQCHDNIDNDGNGLTDYPADGGCSSATDNAEIGYTPPPSPPPGVIVYKTVSKRDYYNVVMPDMLAHGGVNETAAHGYSQYAVNQVSPTGTRICYLYDPTAYITEWSLGGFDSPGDNNMAAWDPSAGKWYVKRANQFGNKRYNYLTCKTLAAPDTSLTATANGTTGTNITVAAGTPVTLTWLSQYGKIRQGTFTSTNFDLTATVAGHFETVTNFSCNNDGGGWDDNSVNIASKDRSQLALSANCFQSSTTEWVPESTTSRPYGGSKVVTPAVTTTYTYKGTNANGSNSSRVTVTVTGAAVVTQCNDGVDNDSDGPIDLADPDCTDATDPTEGSVTPQCLDTTDNDGDGLTDSADPGCAVNPNNPGTTEGGAPTLSCNVNPATVVVGGSATYSASVTGGSGSYTYDWTPTGGQSCTGTGNTRTCTFADAGYYQMHLTATGQGNLSCDFDAVNTTEVCSPSSVTITTSADRVVAGTPVTVTWNASAGCTCTVSGPGLSSTAPSGSQQVTVTGQSTFTTSCSGTAQSALVNVVPRFQEF